jgi:hypothetical protein
MDSCFLSSDVVLNIKLLVQNLHGSMPEMADGTDRPLSYAECLSRRAGCAAADLHLTFQLYAHGRPLGLPERTCNMPGSRLRWNEWITFRARYCDLSPDAWVALSVVGSDGPRSVRTLGSARLELFNEHRQLRSGVSKVMLEMDSIAVETAADGAAIIGHGGGGKATTADEHEMARLEGLSARHEAATAQPNASLDWLNRATYALLEHQMQACALR